MPAPKPRRFRYPGRKPVGDREALTGILFVLKTGIPWEDLPVEMGCGCGMTCWRSLHDWNEAGVWADSTVLLASSWTTPTIDWSRAAVDSTFARAFGGVEGQREKPYGSRSSRRQAARLVDGNGVPLAGDVTPANTPRSRSCCRWWTAERAAGQDRGDPGGGRRRCTADRAYDSEPHREELRRRGIEPKLAKRNTEHGSGLGVYRWVVERFFSWLHGFRKLRFVTEKTAGNAIRLPQPRPRPHLSTGSYSLHCVSASKGFDPGESPAPAHHSRREPQSVSELAKLTDRAEPNLLRTLTKLAAYGLLELRIVKRCKVSVPMIGKLHVEIDPFTMADHIEIY